MTEHQGTCRCGSVKVLISGNPGFSGYCHCEDCRRSNGGPLIAFAGFPVERFIWKSRETLAEWQNSPFRRLFCKSCGTPVAYLDEAVPDIVFFYTSFMLQPGDFPPESHSYFSHRIGWLQLADDLPKFDQTSFPRT